MARAISTRMAWEPRKETTGQTASSDEQVALYGSESRDSVWSAVDERTMDPYYYMRMRRQQNMPGLTVGAERTDVAVASASAQRGRQFVAPPPAGHPKRSCRLSDSRGRVRVDFREVAILKDFVNEHGKIVSRRKSALAAKAQRKVARAIKTARQMALLHPEPKPGLSLEEMRSMGTNQLLGK
jgi:small subunit ribosomal protein S18